MGSSEHASSSRFPICVFALWATLVALTPGCSTRNRTADAATPGVAVATESGRQGNLQTAPAVASHQGDPYQPNLPQEPRRRTCWQALRDAFTKPWYGNYLGPDNLGFDKKPIDALDAAARDHDLAYGRHNAAGLGGVFWCLDAGKDDMELAKRAFLAIPSLDFGGKVMGVATGVAMGCIGVIKAPLAEIRDTFHLQSQSPASSPPP